MSLLSQFYDRHNSLLLCAAYTVYSVHTRQEIGIWFDLRNEYWTERSLWTSEPNICCRVVAERTKFPSNAPMCWLTAWSTRDRFTARVIYSDAALHRSNALFVACLESSSFSQLLPHYFHFYGQFYTFSCGRKWFMLSSNCLPVILPGNKACDASTRRHRSETLVRGAFFLFFLEFVVERARDSWWSISDANTSSTIFLQFILNWTQQ